MNEKIGSLPLREAPPTYKFKVGDVVTQETLSQSDFYDHHGRFEHFHLLGKIISRSMKKEYGFERSFYTIQYEDKSTLKLPEDKITFAFFKPYKFKIGQKVRIRREVHREMNPVTTILEPHVLKESAKITKRSRKSTRMGDRQRGKYGLRAENQYLLQWTKNDSSYTLDEWDLELA